jgi:gliding motility-associated-like protein
MWNNKLITLLLTSLSVGNINAQVTVNNTNTVAWYVQNVLLGANVTVSNITYNGSAANANVNQPSVGSFSNPLNQVGLTSGLIMGSGNVQLAAQSNNSTGATLGNAGPQQAGNDPQLQSLVAGTQFDKCIIEFDFVPTGDSISFKYVFASEEYPEYVCSGFNDVFGFFLSGPIPSGGTYTNYNVARVPASLNPLTFTNTPVAINTINGWPTGSNYSDAGCSSIDPNFSLYSVYYVNNPSGGPYQYDGRTIALPVAVPVVCGETYHIKLAIADLGDAILDSGVFLEAGSFSSNGISAIGATAPDEIVLCDPNASLTVDFNAGSNPPPYNFWDFGDGVGTSTLPNPSYTYSDTGFYQVMYVAIDSTGSCAVSDTVYFDVTLIFPEQFSATFDIPPFDPCDGVDSLLVNLAFTGTGADSLIWNMGNGDTFYNLDSISYSYFTQGSYTISLIAIDTRCNFIDTITTQVNYFLTYSEAQATAPDDVFLCSTPFSVDFTAGNNPPPHNYWDFGDGSGTSTLTNPTYIYADSGSYTVMYVAIDSSTCNIADTVYFNVTLIIPPQFSAQFNVPQVDPCSSIDSLLVEFQFTGSGADSLIWDMGNGDIFYNLDDISYYYSTQGNYVVTLTAIDTICGNSETLTVNVDYILNYTVSEATAPDDIFLCAQPLIVDFSAGTNPPPHSFWDFGDGNTSTLQNPSHTYALPGDYTVMYVAIDSSTCNIADSVYFNVTLQLAETFSATLDFTPPPPCGADSMLVELAFTGSGADDLIWNMGNGDIFNGPSVSYYYTVPGNYIITLTAIDNACNNTATISNNLFFAGNVVTEVVIPNVFTPNGDGVNDLFATHDVDGTAEYHMIIYNRWGRKVFETTDSSEFWNGRVNDGSEAETGVYYYQVKYRDVCQQEEVIKSGFVTLAR